MDVVVLDTCVILKYTNDEEGADEVEGIFNLIKNKGALAIIPSIVLAEIFGVLYKANALDKAMGVIEYLRGLGVVFVDISPEIAVIGGIFKVDILRQKRASPMEMD